MYPLAKSQDLSNYFCLITLPSQSHFSVCKQNFKLLLVISSSLPHVHLAQKSMFQRTVRPDLSLRKKPIPTSQIFHKVMSTPHSYLPIKRSVSYFLDITIPLGRALPDKRSVIVFSFLALSVLQVKTSAKSQFTWLLPGFYQDHQWNQSILQWNPWPPLGVDDKIANAKV